ncbi:MAG: NAD(P)H-dependent oxidoreductase [bacterium]|nr:NAD(P)H-dependent oxidoreductase [bacterium]
MNILIICGSVHKDSLNLRVAKKVEVFVKEAGHNPTLIHLGDEKLPMFEGYDVDYPPRVVEILKLMTTSDGVMIVTPEYHRAIPAVVKNLFEYIDDEKVKIEDIPFALISAVASQWGGVASQSTYLQMLRVLRAWLVPDQVFIPRADKVFLSDGTVTDESYLERIKKLTNKLIRAAEVFKSF